MCLKHFSGTSPKVYSLTAGFLYGARVFPLTTSPLLGILCYLPYLNDTYETSPLISHYALVEAEHGPVKLSHPQSLTFCSCLTNI